MELMAYLKSCWDQKPALELKEMDNEWKIDIYYNSQIIYLNNTFITYYRSEKPMKNFK